MRNFLQLHDGFSMEDRYNPQQIGKVEVYWLLCGLPVENEESLPRSIKNVRNGANGACESRCLIGDQEIRVNTLSHIKFIYGQESIDAS